MTSIDTTRTLDNIRRDGLDVLHHELGVVGMVRFTWQFHKGSGDYTAERAQLQAGLSTKDVMAAIEKVRAEREQAPKRPIRRTGGWTVTTTTPSDNEILRVGLQALHRELGDADLIRYLQQYSPGIDEDTAERAELAGDRIIDVICDAVEKRRAAEAEHEQDS